MYLDASGGAVAVVGRSRDRDRDAPLLLPHAPTFYPSEDEFRDPVKFIAS